MLYSMQQILNVKLVILNSNFLGTCLTLQKHTNGRLIKIQWSIFIIPEVQKLQKFFIRNKVLKSNQTIRGLFF